MPLRDNRVRRAVALVCAGVLVTACGGELEPRRSAVAAADTPADIFESPRRVVEIEASVDPGGVEIPALVSGVDPVDVVAPADGVIFDVVVAAGDQVVEGDPVMTFLPAASRAEELQLSILDLRRELATEQDDDQALIEIEAEVAALRAALQARTISLEAPASGVVSGTREGLELRVAEGRTLFTISSDETLAVVALSVPDVVEELAVGDAVTVRRAVVGARPVAARVGSFEEVRDLVRTRIEFVDGVADGVEIGDRVQVEFEVGDETLLGNAAWVPAEALRRIDGRSFLLIQRADGGVERFDTEVHRRTDTSVLVGDPLRRLAPGTALILP